MLSPMPATDGARRPNIILIITDQQRYETVGALGYPHDHDDPTRAEEEPSHGCRKRNRG